MVAVVAFVVALAVRSIYGPQHPGPGNNPDSFGVTFVNDLNRPVVLSLCANPPTCNAVDYSHNISSGSTDAENIGTDVKTTWAITEQNGSRFRKCVTLLYPNYVNNPTIHLSRAVQCA